MSICKNSALIALLLLAFSCGKSNVDLSDQQTKKFLPISFSAEVRSLDPGVGIDDQSQVTVKMLFDGLMAFNLSGELVPALAERYEISSDGKTYTFLLRNAKWSNGRPITAFDFEYSWKKVIAANVKGSAAYNYYPIKNVHAVIKGERSLEEVGIKALDAKTFRVELEHPTPYFLEAVASSSFFPVCAEIDKSNPNWMSAVGKAFVCSGPFTLAKHRHNDELILVKNLSYWDAEHVKLPGIKIAIIKDATTQLNMFEKGQLAWLGKPLTRLPPDAIPHLKKRKLLNFVPSMGVYWFFINTEAFPFNNKKIRKAFAYAINRRDITEHVLGSGEIPALGVLPKEIDSEHAPYFSDHDLECARKLFEEGLEELGITRTTLPPIVLSYNIHEYHQRTAQVIQQQWEAAFNIKIQLQQTEWKVHYQNLLTGNYQIGGMNWYSWLHDPIYIMQTFRARADGINMSRWEDARYRVLLDAADQEMNTARRSEIFHEAEMLLMEEMPVIPIYFTTSCFVKQKELKDVYVSELNQIDFKWASFK